MKNQSNQPEKGRPCLFIILLLTTIAFIFNPHSGYSQGEISKKVDQLKKQGVFKTKLDIPRSASIDKRIQKSLALDMHRTKSEILKSSPEYLSLSVPYNEGEFKLLLYRVNNQVNVITDKGSYQPEKTVSYTGTVEGDSSAIAAITFSKKETNGIIYTSHGNYNMSGDSTVLIFNDKALPVQKFECNEVSRDRTLKASGSSNAFFSLDVNSLKNVPVEQATTTATKCVNWYWETDYDVYVNNGNSIANVTTWIQGLFNQVATLYANDGITVNLKTLKVWTVADPYTGPSTNDFFNQFTSSGPQSFDGDFATLIGYGNGGMAWQNEYCDIAKYKKCYCGISTSYNAVPVWSWSVDCVTHENGHLLGSPHTHACRWNGNNTAIDGCYTTEGGCASPGIPTGGGTIMSYCQLTGVGVNFTLGFGPQPKALITNYLNAATCLLSCGTQCVVPAQPGTITGAATACPASTQKYSVAAVSGATSYSWALPSGWTGTSTNDSISVLAGSSGGTISVTAVNSCGNSVAQTLNVSVSGVTPLQPGAITGNISPCSNSSQAYSIAAVSGATSYTWVLPSGWTGTSTTTSITSTTGSSGGTISVKANNSCGSSTAQTLAVTISGAAPVQPGTITGNISPCTNSSQAYSITAVAGATSYTWTLPSGWTGTSTTTSITATAGTAGGTISVKANNSCSSSTAQTLVVTISGAAPLQPGTITGNISPCTNSSQTYSIAAVSGATSYTWVLPSGWTGTSTTTSITTTAGTGGGTISVKANNSCGNSAAQTLAVTISGAALLQPGAISGNMAMCKSTSQTYSVALVSGASSYKWTLPSGWSGSSTTNTITATAGASGTISVTAVNSCGSSTARTLSVTVTAVPAQPGTMSGNSQICKNTSQTYSVPVVSGASSYAWTLPSGWTGSSTTNSITVAVGTAGGTISVKAVNNCGSSAARSKSVSITLPPGQPGTISGNASVCASSSQKYSASASYATTYTWTLPAGWTGTSTTSSIVATVGASGGIISVIGNNMCGSSPLPSTKSVSINPLPGTPGAISGNIVVLAATNQLYSVSPVTGATSYTWKLPSGWSGSSTSYSISATSGSAGGTISVSANNTCGKSASQTLDVRVDTVLPVGIVNTQNRLFDPVDKKTIQKGVRINNVFPNPTNDYVNIEIVSDTRKRVNIDLFDFSGRKVLNKIIELSEGLNQERLSLTNLISGSYVVALRDDQNNLIDKTGVIKF